MTTSCLINNYNYLAYVSEAIDSALRQTTPFDQIVVVDDGSTDGSVEMLRSKYANHPIVEILSKDNHGQLSCFNEGFARATGDIVFFLDADDCYEPNYVENALAVYERGEGCDFLFCARRLFGLQQEVLLEYPEDRDMGYSVIRTVYAREWIGAATSCLSMRRSVLNKILPLPFVDDWRLRADDCLVFGASLAGARKRYVAEPYVRYRVHGRNRFCGRANNCSLTYRRRLAINSLFEYLERKLNYNVVRLADFHHREYCTIEDPTFAQLLKYLRVCRVARYSIWRRFGCVGVMINHYLRGAWQSRARKRSAAPISVSDHATSEHATSQRPVGPEHLPIDRGKSLPQTQPHAA